MKQMKGRDKADSKQFWCEMCGAACEEIDEENYPELSNAPHLCPGCRKSYEESCNLR